MGESVHPHRRRVCCPLCRPVRHMMVPSMRLWLLLVPALLSGALRFERHVIAEDLTGGYQVVVADMNRDGKPDLIALASGLKELVWYENPGWQRHVIAGGQSRMINCAAYDYDGDGIPELALATEFSNRPPQSIGIVSILHHQGDPAQPWSIREIDRLPTSHRLRWADLDGTGRKVLVNAPLAGARGDAPEFRDHVPLVFYRPGEWRREVISDAEEGVLHGIWVTPWDRPKSDALVIASFVGLHLYQREGGGWQRTTLSQGNPAAWPKGGSSDVAVGHTRQKRFLAAIEPWHGNEVAVYQPEGNSWTRQVIDTSLQDGHTILTADLDGDRRDEIVAGFRGPGRSVYLYTGQGTQWSRQFLDEGGIAAAACTAADLNRDRRLDVICIGSATHNLVWYENRK